MPEPVPVRRVSLAYSGGGIRAAAIAAGVLSCALDEAYTVDHLSCVSGGGFLGSAYTDWLAEDARRNNTQNMDPVERRRHVKELTREFFHHFERNSAFVCDCHGRRRCWYFESVAPLYIFFSLVSMLAMSLFPAAVLVTSAMSITFIGDILRENQSSSLWKMIGSFAGVAFFLFFLSKIKTSNSRSLVNRLRLAFRALSTHVGSMAVLCVIGIAGKNTRWSNDLVSQGAVALLVVGYILLRLVPSILLPSGATQYLGVASVMLFFGFIFEYHVYEHSVLGIPYSQEVWDIFLIVSTILYTFQPLLLSLYHQRLMHNMFRWRVQDSFYKNKGSRCHCMGTCQGDLGNSLADVPSYAPQYIACATVNNWKMYGHSSIFDRPYDVFTFSSGPEPMGTRLGDRPVSFVMRTPKPNPSVEELTKECMLSLPPMARRNSVSSMSWNERIAPAPVGDPELGDSNQFIPPLSISQAMAMSGAAMASNMGRLGYENSSFVVTLTGITLGRWQATTPSPPDSIRYLPLLVHMGFFLCLFLATWFNLDWLAYILVGVATVVVVSIGSLSSMDSMWARKWMRRLWFLLPGLFDSYRNSVGLTEINRDMPDRLYLSDGGHMENLGLFPLLCKQVENIVVVDSYVDPTHECPCLRFVLEHARRLLGCSFYALRHENPGPDDFNPQSLLPRPDSRISMDSPTDSDMEEDAPPSPLSEPPGPEEVESADAPLRAQAFGVEAAAGMSTTRYLWNPDMPPLTEEVEVALHRVFTPKVRSHIFSQTEQEDTFPRVLHFWVDYKNGRRGKITYIKPRKLAQQPEEMPRDPEDSLGTSAGTISQDDLEHLDGCFWDCCHDPHNFGCCKCRLCGASAALCGVFPRHSTMNQCFTPRQYRAYFENGYASMKCTLNHPRWAGYQAQPQDPSRDQLGVHSPALDRHGEVSTSQWNPTSQLGVQGLRMEIPPPHNSSASALTGMGDCSDSALTFSSQSLTPRLPVMEVLRGGNNAMAGTSTQPEGALASFTATDSSHP